MKKVLAIMVLGLLWSGSVYAKTYKSNYKNYFDKKVSGFGYDKKSFQNSKDEALLNCQNESKKKNIKLEGCLLHDFQIFSAMDTLFNREIEKVVWNEEVDKFEKTLRPDEIVKGIKYETSEEKKIKKEQNDLAKMIDKAKDTCENLGFKKNTDKFSECTLKLYTQEVDNKVAKEIAKRKPSGSSNSGTVVIYDPVRDKKEMMDRGMKIITGKCKLGISC